ncbi:MULTISPECIES: hypothetical protein [unclassified Oceanispirochaeta]|uniref:hypothetical protein n=1 Tax=unclassified Oceanispirochaeta TaxID=2635722 RepID=UPI000E091B31|nr:MULTISPECIES: hypothetical protein [unclassified Oceanispirochaeta]MBF9018908.1 hypothetical protein [Oceanispirochaeta sp. M2]NPD75407.1 hypothetical protein [Oceanispirochaeta sp. M1]RDG28750.1 hypothetical protein DV872_25275 [Oceanispirochaeta sp. M1]
MKTICKIFLTLLIMLISSCDGGDSSSSDYEQIIDHIDTADAQILFKNIYNSESDPAELKGINTTGALVTPLIYNSDGSEVMHENFWIDGIYDLNENYYLLSSNYTNGDIEDYQLISKESGAAIHFPEESGWLSNHQDSGSGERDPYWGNNPYYCYDSYSDRIVEFSINGSSISLNNYVTLDEGFRYFVMDNVANVAYIYQDIDNNYVLKIVDKDNTILYSDSEFDDDIWVTHNGLFQYSDFLDLVTLVFDEGSGTYTEERSCCKSKIAAALFLVHNPFLNILMLNL